MNLRLVSQAVERKKTAIIAKLSSNPIVYRQASGAYWSLIGIISSKLLSVLATALIARLLGKDNYGAMGMVLSTMAVFAVFAGFGLGSTSTKYIAEFKGKNPDKAGRIYGLTTVVALLTGGTMSLALFFSAGYLAEHNLNRPELASLLAASSIYLFLSTMHSVQTAALSGFEAFRKTARINIIQGFTTPLLSVPLVWLYGVQGAISAFSISAGIGLALCSLQLHNECKKFRIPAQCNRAIWSEWKTLWHFSLPALIAMALVGPATWLCNTFLIKQPGGYGEMGLYNAADQWKAVITMLPVVLSSALLPILAESHGKEDKKEFRDTIALNFKLSLIVSLPVTVLMIVFSKQLGLVFGSQFNGTAPLIAVLMCSCFISLIISPIGSALSGAGRMWSATLLNFCWAASLIILARVLIPRYLAMGLASAYLLSYLMFAVYTVSFADALSLSIFKTYGKLILFAFSLLSISLYASVTGFNSLYLSCVLLVVSFGPLYRLLVRMMPVTAKNSI